MLPRIDANVRPVGTSNGPGAGAVAGDGRQGALQRALQNLVGQNVPAQVQSRFSDGSSLVKVADQNVRMMLPADVKVGAEVSLTVLSANPRPTFQLGTGTPGATVVYPDGGELPTTLPSQNAPATLPGNGKPGQPGQAADPALRGNLPTGADNAEIADANPANVQNGRAAGAQAEGVRPQSLAATLLGKAALAASADLPALDHTTPQSTLSATARALATVLPAGGQMAQLALVGKTALFGNSLPDTDALTEKLHDTISKSGLFYESHVTEWAKGERPLSDLMREPQMQHAQQMQRLAQQSGEALARLGPGGPDLTPAQMVNQQLHTQEQGRVQWHGEAWPGQAMQWEIKRDERESGRQPGSQEEQEPMWRSGVRFRLPMLGKVAATVTMIGEQVHVQLHTDNGEAVDALRAYAGRFESAMAAAGAQLASLGIAQQADSSDAGEGVQHVR
ncbi:MAG: flagellar hook-length control protein FliK [Duganella sp.]